MLETSFKHPAEPLGCLKDDARVPLAAIGMFKGVTKLARAICALGAHLAASKQCTEGQSGDILHSNKKGQVCSEPSGELHQPGAMVLQSIEKHCEDARMSEDYIWGSFDI